MAGPTWDIKSADILYLLRKTCLSYLTPYSILNTVVGAGGLWRCGVTCEPEQVSTEVYCTKLRACLPPLLGKSVVQF